MNPKGKKNFNIVHLSTQSKWGGGEKQILYLMKTLQEEEISQKLVCANNSALSKKASDLGFEVEALPKGFLFFLFWLPALWRLSSSTKDTIFHAHDANAHTCLFLLGILKPKIKTVLHRRIVKKKVSLFAKWKLNHPSIQSIICISSAVKNSLAPLIKEKTKLRYIPSGISLNNRIEDQEKPELFNFSEKTRVYLSIGSLLPQKQHHIFIEIAGEYFKRQAHRKEDTLFLILGKGPLYAALKSDIESRGIERNCKLLGFRKDTANILKNSSALVCTSREEALGNVILEAFLYKTPVIAAKSGGIPDLVEDEKTGLLIEDFNVNDFVSAIERMESDQELKNRLIENASTKLENFNIQKTNRLILELYSSL